MQASEVKRLKFGDVITCDLTFSSPARTTRLSNARYYDASNNPIPLENMYTSHGPRPTLFVAAHEDSEKTHLIVLVCPISDEMRYVNLDESLVQFSVSSDVLESNPFFKSELNHVNCRMMISLCDNQVRSARRETRIKTPKLIEITSMIKEYLKDLDSASPL